MPADRVSALLACSFLLALPSLALGQNNTSVPVELCDEIVDAAECNATAACYYPNNTNGTGPCLERSSIPARSHVDAVEMPWCYQHFPFEVTVFLYFANCFTGGYALIGLWYNSYHYNRATKVDKITKKRFRNRLRGSQWIFVAWSSAFLLLSLILIFSMLHYLNDPMSCYWVGASYTYIVVCVLALFYFGSWALKEYVEVLRQRHANSQRDKKRMGSMFNHYDKRPGHSLRYI
ncbi:hypothetical protein DIPPA_23104 [Diplonema papillatum]|nr:hypothetical protein DIPPA_23104 [Diplonema papillatum]